jgi:hypothetical protein
MTPDGLDDLRAKLAARKGRPGFAANVAELERLIEEAEGRGYVYRDAGTGHYVTPEYAEANPTTTYKVRTR